MIELVGGEKPRASDEFKARLREYDATLIVGWHERRRKWLLERCVEHFATVAEHDHTCRREYVWMVQSAEGDAMPLGDHVFQKLAEIDTQRQGYGPEEAARWCQERAREQAEMDERREAAAKDIYRHNQRLNRRQLLRARDLILRHDLRVNQ